MDKKYLILIFTFVQVVSFYSSLSAYCIPEEAEIRFPYDIKEFQYSIINNYDYSDDNYEFGYRMSEILHYEIMDINIEDNSFNVRSIHTYKLYSVYGMDVEKIVIKVDDEEIRREIFSTEHDYEFLIDRRIDLSSGKVVEYLSDSLGAEYIYMSVKLDDYSEEILLYLSHWGDVGYTPYPWRRVYEPVSYSSNDIQILSTSIGSFECYSVISGNTETLYDVNSNLCIQRKYTYSSDAIYMEETDTLSSIVVGREWDSVNINILIDDNRIDVGQEPNITITGTYNYDGKKYKGQIELNSPILDSIGERRYTVLSIFDPIYGTSEFTCDEIPVIWDKIQLELTLIDSRINVNEEPNIEYSGIYIYDNTPFTGHIEITPTESTEIGIQSYTIENITDNLYDLTSFENNEITCIWDQIKIISGGVSNDKAKIKDVETIWFKAVYEYDEEIFDYSKGTLYINDEPAQWSHSNERWEIVITSEEPMYSSYQVTGILDSKYELTTINDVSGIQNIEWERKGIPGFPTSAIALGLVFLLVFRNRLLT